MAYEKLDGASLDYKPCRYGASKLQFRGPMRDLTSRYAAFLGGSEVYGRFLPQPFPTLIEAQLGAPCVNLGWPNAGLDAFLHDSEILGVAAGSCVVVLQVLGAPNMSNRLYSVHPRRNDRFVQASPVLRALYSEVDFTEFHFTRHMLGYLARASPGRFEMVVAELQEAWIARMRLLLIRIGVPVVLIWISNHRPPDCREATSTGQEPAFVTRAMLRAVEDHVVGIIDATASCTALAKGTNGMVYSQFEASAAAKLPGLAAHEDAARALVPVLRGYFAV